MPAQDDTLLAFLGRLTVSERLELNDAAVQAALGLRRALAQSAEPVATADVDAAVRR